MFKATFNNISVLLVEETGVAEENHQPVASHWQTLSHNVVSNTPYMYIWVGFELTTLVMIGTDCTGSCKSWPLLPPKVHVITMLIIKRKKTVNILINIFDC
jgi:hypothetical protein